MTAEDLTPVVEQLRESIRARDDFLAIAAHELRSPMHALFLQVQLALVISRRTADPELTQRLERVALVLDRYVKRATMLLDIARINAGRLSLQFEEFDFVEALQETVDTYAVEADFHRTELRVTTPSACRGRWDRLAVLQVIANLLSNAIKYGDGQPIDIVLSRGLSAVQLLVRDRGAGISPQDRQRIFERFEQVVTEQPRSGFGVGLWLVRSLVDAHCGSISVASAPGGGTAFTIELPLEPRATALEATHDQ